MRLSGWAVFDLDGTLVDTLGEIHLALNRVLVRHGRNSLQREVVRDLVGNGPKTLMERAWSRTGSDARGVKLFYWQWSTQGSTKRTLLE